LKYNLANNVEQYYEKVCKYNIRLVVIGSKTVVETSTGNLCGVEKFVTLEANIDY
jgi:hypothetical protein